MKYRQLGKSGLMVSEVSFGGHQTGGFRGDFEVPLAERAKVIERGLELGINYFDTTAEHEMVSLSMVFDSIGWHHRDNVVVTGMYNAYKRHRYDQSDEHIRMKKRVRTEIEKALADFDPLDVFNLCGDSLPHSRDRTLGAIEALEEAKERGQIKHYGFSTHTLDYAINMIENHPEFTLVMVPFNITTSQVCERLFPIVRKHQTGIVGMKALAARGFLNVEINPGDFGHDLSVPIAAIKWVLQSPEISCTIPAMNSIQEVEENVRASGSELTDEESKMLEEVKVKFNETIEKEDRSWYFFRDWVKNLR